VHGDGARDEAVGRLKQSGVKQQQQQQQQQQVVDVSEVESCCVGGAGAWHGGEEGDVC
jgi:hypothetical protein